MPQSLVSLDSGRVIWNIPWDADTTAPSLEPAAAHELFRPLARVLGGGLEQPHFEGFQTGIVIPRLLGKNRHAAFEKSGTRGFNIGDFLARLRGYGNRKRGGISLHDICSRPFLDLVDGACGYGGKFGAPDRALFKLPPSRAPRISPLRPRPRASRGRACKSWRPIPRRRFGRARRRFP